MIHGYTVTVVIPTKNEEAGIGATIKRVPSGVDKILVVDGDSKDRTGAIARELGCKVIVEKRKGYGRAYLTALENIDTDLVATCDGDGTYPIELLPVLIARLDERQLDFMNGSRFPLVDLSSMYFKNFWGNAALTFVFNTIFKTTVTDILSGMWVFRAKILPKLRLASSNWNFSEEIKYEVIRRGLHFGEEPIPYRDRLGETKMSPWRTGIENLIFMIQLYLFRGQLIDEIASIRERHRVKAIEVPLEGEPNLRVPHLLDGAFTELKL